MAVKLLVLDMNAELYCDLLSPKFPDVEIHAVHHAPEADKVIAEVDVIVGLGHHLPRAMLAAAKSLRWVQALTTGTETLTAPGVLPPDVILLVAGKESRPQRYQQMALELGIDPARLRWVGATTDPLALYAAADVFLLPSLYDQMPNASLEAMACGLPLVVSSTSGTRDLIEDGREGYVRDWWRPSDWIGPISQCLASSESMGAQAHQTVLPYTFERMIQEWRQLYASLLPSS